MVMTSLPRAVKIVDILLLLLYCDGVYIMNALGVGVLPPFILD